jgi:hypothetical protein
MTPFPRGDASRKVSPLAESVMSDDDVIEQPVEDLLHDLEHSQGLGEMETVNEEVRSTDEAPSAANERHRAREDELESVASRCGASGSRRSTAGRSPSSTSGCRSASSWRTGRWTS